ncbi:hypothetical protein RRG08_021036 [Elysia crispata]|uniref:Uncharacterized protein n=1 Tax=Elysia crispata TaxID=231223 RepID=A0AAE1AFB7_9GAST|nr:hypothetical protein RRG08_021036 [Elysia crispata]
MANCSNKSSNHSIMKTDLVLCVLFCIAFFVAEGYPDCLTGSVCDDGRPTDQGYCCQTGSFPIVTPHNSECECIPEDELCKDMPWAC